MRTFLTADWRYLAMLNYEVDASLLAGRVPAGTELERWNGAVLVSVVGFLFKRARVFGVSVPCHRDFEEVNLRFYVRRRVSGEWRRGVVFIKEIVPRWAVAALARASYGEKYVSMPMGHSITLPTNGVLGGVRYSWRSRSQQNMMSVEISGQALPLVSGSEAEFVTEHYWGYAVRRNGNVIEYEVTHPRWSVWSATAARLDCDIETVYGKEFAKYITAEPGSAFVALGSEIAVKVGKKL